MRQKDTSDQQQRSACYGAGTRVDVHRSRLELERILSKYGAADVLFVEADARSSIQFAMHGRYVQLSSPLPDPASVRFTHTPSGKVRTPAAQDRAYEQALREHWRALVLAVRGKLQSVESGISTFEQEFDRLLVPHIADEKKPGRKAPKAVNWLLGGSHSVAIALVAAFLVPASAVGAFALPTNVVGRLAAPFRSTISDASAGRGGSDVAIVRGGWSPARGSDRSENVARLLARRSPSTEDNQLRHEAALKSPPVDDEPGAPPDAPTVQSPSSDAAGASAGEPQTAGTNDGGGHASSGGPAPQPDESGGPKPSAPNDPPADPPPPPPDEPSDANGHSNANANGQAQGDGQGQDDGGGNGQGNGNGNGNANGHDNDHGNGNDSANGHTKGGS